MWKLYRQKKRDKLKQMKKTKYVIIFSKFGVKKEMISMLQKLLYKRKKRDQVRKIKKLSKKGLIIFLDLLILISNLETFQKITDLIQLIEKTKRVKSKTNEKDTKKRKTDKITFILDITGDFNL